MFNDARQLPSISIALPTIIPSSNFTSLPASSSSVPSSTSSPPSASITSTPDPSSSSSSDPESSIITPPIESKNITSEPSSSVISTSATDFITQSSLLPSLSSSASLTANITTIVTSINGQRTTFTSQLPTSLVGLTPNTNSSPRITIIASVTAGSIFLLCLALSCVFGYRRHKLRKALAASTQRKEGKGLLDGEDFDDDVVPMRSYQDHYLVASGSGPSAVPRSVSPAPSLIRSRVSESGSIFREEVWPPPGFVDPIANRSSQVDLSRIVDDVMGPSASESARDVPSSSSQPGHDYFGSIGSSYSAHSHSNFPSSSHERDASGYSQLSIKSTTPLIPTPNHPKNERPPPSAYIDPFASINDMPSPSPSPSVYHPSTLPPGALAPTTPGQPPVNLLLAQISQPATADYSQGQPQEGSAHDTRSVSPSPSTGTSTSRLYSASTAQPKKSSPLARALSGDARIWLGRSLHPPK